MKIEIGTRTAWKQWHTHKLGCAEHQSLSVMESNATPHIRSEPLLENTHACHSGTDHTGRWGLTGSATRMLLIVLLLVGSCVAVLAYRSLRQNDGWFVYALDDPYIHMALARHIVDDGVWGVTGDRFTSCSSSLLWTALLALVYFVCGSSTLAPFALNLVFTGGFVVAIHVLLAYRGMSRRVESGVLLAVICAAPVVPLIFAGLEHILHAGLIVVMIHVAATDLASPVRRPLHRLLLVGSVSPLVRYESLFVVFAVCVLLLVRRRVRQAVVLGVAALCPIAVYGIISASKGWYVLPNSIMLKAYIPDLTHSTDWLNTVFHWVGEAGRYSHMSALMVCVLALGITRCAQRRAFWDPAILIATLFLATSVMHLQFARIGWFYRYEAYLVVMGILAVVCCLPVRLPLLNRLVPRTGHQHVVLAVVLAIVLWPVGQRAARAHAETVRATTNIYEQQFQMARFLERFYSGAAVAVNDIGAISYYTDTHLVDLWGLAHPIAAEARRNGRLTPDAIRSITQHDGVRIAAVYEHWYRWGGGLPPEWKEVGSWTIRHNVVAGGRSVTWYAVSAGEARSLAHRLREFAPDLPPHVRWEVRDSAGR